jgi:hypothetical protein
MQFVTGEVNTTEFPTHTHNFLFYFDAFRPKKMPSSGDVQCITVLDYYGCDSFDTVYDSGMRVCGDDNEIEGQ